MGEIRVTDKRMFTPDGRLKEEFERALAEPDTEAEAEPETRSAPPAEPEPAAQPPAPAPAAGADWAGGNLPLPEGPVAPPPGLMELFEFVSGWALACMGDVPLPDGRLVRDLDASRFYIDLLGALHERFGRGLSAQELHFVESYLDQLRLRYVSRRG
ncbi:MAG: DUF1844 domain-containing protein [Thermoanaerobaculia bacterium]|nr:MAG: DUF1844 domain-containing protein [Thermoanaerobaculia bacterium]MBZ0101277.1 DUF1844 domain-containing protein [Thermoanaerobaculia bacterium]